MKNTKGLIVIVGLVMALLGVSAWLGISHTQKSKAVFDSSGYILEADSGANSEKILISQGGSYERNELTKEVSFEDAAGEKQTMPLDSFVHYDDGSVTAMAEGVVLDLEDISGNLVNHYPIKSGVKMTKNGSRFDFSYDGASLDFSECLWKISEASYMVCAPDLQIHFAQDDVRPAGDNLQIRYIDGGVVQLITEENIWHTIAPDVYVEAPSGARFYLASQMLEKGGNKMFASKLSHSANDPAQLPSAEQNNLAVPEISIEAIDGKDGDAGEDGADGVSGVNGTGGQSGEDGVIGEDGAIGQAGEEGDEGEEGSAGGKGSTGAAGAAGVTGGKGNAGSSGDIGDTGYVGNRGNAGLGVEGDSSSKTALPVMTFKEWDVTGNTVSGTIVVADEREILSPNTGSITIFEAASDLNSIVASNVNDYGEPDKDPVFNFSGVSEEGVRFIATGLKPDTEYRITVSSEYVMADNSGAEQTYKRDFIVRTFYTNSSGAYLEVDEVQENSITLTAHRQSYSEETKGTMYLLTEEQYAAGFSTDNAQDGYAQHSVDLISGKETYTFEQVRDGSENIPLAADSLYAAYLLTGPEVKENMISAPILIKTLKRPLEFDAEQPVSVSVNRQKGGFEVYRPQVTDIDAGIKSYIYECLDATTGKVVRTITISDPAIEMATFYVDQTDILTGKNYIFRVKCVFDDNQKETEITLGKESKPIQAMENNIPAIEWKELESGQSGAADEYGQVVIHITGGNVNEPSEQTPISLHILADGIYEKTLLFEAPGENGLVWNPEGETIVPVKLDYLRQNTTYRVAVNAFIDGVETHLGFVTFATRSLTRLAAQWSPTEDENKYAISQEFYLKPVNSQNGDLTDEEAKKWAEHDIKSIGRLELTLYRGSGINKYELASKVLENTSGDPYNSNIVDTYFNPDKPVLLTENFFELSGSDLNDSFNYTLEVTAVYDYTYNIQQDGTNLSDYQNQFQVTNSSRVVSKTMIPPDLPTPGNEGKSLTAEEIYNQDAKKYGLQVDESLPDEAVIGYWLKPGYDNSNTLAREITYYAYEAASYKRAEISGHLNFVQQDSKLTTQEALDENGNCCFSQILEVSPYSAEMPGLIVFFGEGRDTYYDGTRVVFAGKANYNEAAKTLKGMERGYQYVFAYTVRYSSTGTTAGDYVYPFDMADFEDYQKDTKYGVYALNSGVKKAPRSNPVVYSYPKLSDGQRLTINYYYTDGDKTIVEGDTFIMTTSPTGQENPIETIGVSGQWNEVTLTVPGAGSENLIISPWLDYKKYEVPYQDFEIPDIFDKEPVFYMAHYPMDIPDSTIINAIDKMTVLMNTDNISKNELKFTVESSGVSNAVFEAALKRITALKVTFTQGEKKLERYLYMNPNSREARLSTSELDSLVGQEQIEVAYEILYDSGINGWDLLTKESEKGTGLANVALQKLKATNITTPNGETVPAYTWGNYMVLNPAGTNGLIQTAGPANSLFQYEVKGGGLEGKDYSTAAMSFYFDTPTSVVAGSRHYRVYSFSQNGVSEGYYTAEGAMPTSYEVPKQILSKEVGGDSKLNLEKVTPSITLVRSDIAASVTQVTVNRFKLNGFKQFFEPGTSYTPEVRLEVYRVSGGEAFGEPVGVTAPIPVKENVDTYGGQTISGLENNEMYCIIATYRSKPEEEWTPLMSGSDPTTTNYLNFNTKDSVEVDFSQENYIIKNDGYFSKYLTFEYRLSQSYSIHIEYELYDVEGKTLIANAQQLEEAGMINRYPDNYSYNVNMNATMNIGTGTYILPGKSYRLYIRVKDPETGKLLNVENDYFQIVRPLNQKPSSYIEAFAETAALDFYVTVNDTDRSIMGRKYGQTEATDGIFKVRLFKENAKTGAWEYVQSVHDRTLFYISESRQKIRFEGLEQQTKYKLALYAVTDVDESGKNDNGPAAEKETHDWSYYYQGDTLNDGSSKFDIAEEPEYEINSRVQRTLDEQGLYIGSVSLVQEPNQPQKIRLELNEASGLEKITSISYTITSNAGYDSSNEVKNSGGSLFENTGSYSYFTFPDVLAEGSGTYTIVVELNIATGTYDRYTFTYNKNK